MLPESILLIYIMIASICAGVALTYEKPSDSGGMPFITFIFWPIAVPIFIGYQITTMIRKRFRDK